MIKLNKKFLDTMGTVIFYVPLAFVIGQLLIIVLEDSFTFKYFLDSLISNYKLTNQAFLVFWLHVPYSIYSLIKKNKYLKTIIFYWGFLLLILIGAIISDATSEKVFQGRTVTKYGIVYEQDRDIPLNGIIEKYYDNGESSRVNYKDGIASGELKYFFKDGSIKGIDNFRDGLLDGKGLIYWPSGQLRASTEYVKGKKNGLHEQYYENGQLHNRQIFSDDTLVGVQDVFNEDGKFSMINTYNENGLLVRQWLFDENGYIDGESIYQEDGTSVTTRFFEIEGRKAIPINGKLVGQVNRVTPYNENNKIDGVSRSFDRNGNLDSEFTYEDGGLKFTITYKNGKKYNWVDWESGDAGKYSEDGAAIFEINGDKSEMLLKMIE